MPIKIEKGKNMIEIDIEDDICPSCGFPKVDSTGKDMSGNPLCFYCYHRGSYMMTKAFILYVLNEQSKPVSLDELVVLMNEHPINGGRKIFKKRGIYSTVRTSTNEKNLLILTKDRKKTGESIHKDGRRQKEYRIGKRKGVPYLIRYLKKWDEGHFVELKPSKFRQKFRKRQENKYKHLAIAKKIENKEYGRFDFIFTRNLVEFIKKNGQQND